MPDQSPLEIAIGGHGQVPADWMPASQVGPFIFEDPAQAFLITRDCLDDPLPADTSSELGRPLDGDRAAIRDHFVEIKVSRERGFRNPMADARGLRDGVHDRRWLRAGSGDRSDTG